MSRHNLKKINGQRLQFTARVERFGTKPNWHGFPEKTILLRDVKREEVIVADHLWFKCGKWSFDLQPGDTFSFEARVDSYEKGYQGRLAEERGESSYSVDYHLERPTKICKVSRVSSHSHTPASLVAGRP